MLVWHWLACAAPVSAPEAPPTTSTPPVSSVVPSTPATCGIEFECTELGAVGVYVDDSGSVQVADLSGDGVADLVTSTAAYSLPAAGTPLGAPFATYDSGSAGT